MTIHMDKILQEIVDQAYGAARLGRNGDVPDRDLVSAEVLAELEVGGDAMRYVDSEGRIAWKATPSLRDHLLDLQLDAEAEFEAEDVMLDRPAPAIDLSIDALKANLQRLEREWETYQSTRDRDGIFGYLTAVFELVAVWAHEGTAVDYARWAIWLRGHRSAVVSPEPFAAVIFCTADRQKADYRTRSKWSRLLRYAAKFKDLDEPLAAFIKRKGGINKCAARYARRLGRQA